jgi:hypothetical protein
MGVTELRLIGRDDQVACERELKCAGEAEAIDLCDHDCLECGNGIDHRTCRDIEVIADGTALE